MWIITFSCQIVNSISDAIHLLYAVFVDLNRFRLAVLYVNFMIVSSFFSLTVVCFTFCSTAVYTAHNSVARSSDTCLLTNTQYSETRFCHFANKAGRHSKGGSTLGWGRSSNCPQNSALPLSVT